MNLDFLLSPESNGGNGDRAANDRSSKSKSSLSIDYIAPRQSGDDKHRSSKHHRRSHDSSVHHSRSTQSSRSPRAPPPKSPQSKEANHGSSQGNFKYKKSRSPGSPTHRAGSSAEVKPHVCPACDRSFYKLEQLKRHDRLVHLNLRPFMCTTCDLSFGTKQNMQVHLTTRKHRHRLEALHSSHRSGHGSSSRHHR